MNDLSWFLYFAGIAGNIQGSMTAVAILGGFVVAAWAFFAWNEDLQMPKARHIAIPIVCGFIAMIMPSQTTVYAIAASEMGEEVLKSSTATKAQKALDAWLDKQIADEEQ